MKPRTKPMSRGASLVSTARLERRTPKTAPKRDTGFSPAVKLAARTRAGGGDPTDARCEADGVWLGLHGGQVHHRMNRQMGGSRTRNTIQNAALLCGDPYTGCHGAATREEQRMRDRGFVLNSGQNPLLVAIRPYGAGQAPRWLTAGGGYGTEASEVAA